MGKFQRPSSLRITDFWPDDTDTTMYFSTESYLGSAELLVKVQAKWPNATLDKLNISSEHIHTYCLGYGQYYPSDYTNFIVITYKQ